MAGMMGCADLGGYVVEISQDRVAEVRDRFSIHVGDM